MADVIPISRGALQRKISEDEPLEARILEANDLLNIEPEPEDHIVPHLIYKRCVTPLAGLAGSGKTFISQKLMSACAVGGKWLGQPVRQCRSLAIFSEERGPQLQARQRKICRHYKMEWTDLSGWIAILPREEIPIKNKIFSCYRRGRAGIPHTFWENISLECRVRQIELLILDNTQNLYDGSFYDDTEVRSFLRWLDDEAEALDIAIMLLANPPKDGSSYYRGSVEWHNTPRHALSLNPHLDKKGVKIGSEILLRVEKDSYLASSHPFKDPGLILDWSGEVPRIKEPPLPGWNGYE